MELEDLGDWELKSFAEGGPPVTAADFAELGLDLTQCVDAGRKRSDGTYEPLGEAHLERLRAISARWWLAWSRDSRAPRISHLIVVDIPTGSAPPVAQKPYPIAHRYIEAVRAEINKLLAAGLIEPGISNWASPTLLTVKKDSTLDAIKIKIVCDYRKLNAVTVPDSGGLGNQEEILSGFGGGQKYTGIGDIAGGFYQFCLDPASKHKSAFVLPTSMGGTTFQWRVCPVYVGCRLLILEE
jgi:hypothetical protein